jgi:SAM-dependent methyltransferase
MPKGAEILEVGAGPTNPTSAFLATLGVLRGVDACDEALANAHLLEARLTRPDGTYTYDNETFDAAVSNYVVEHVADPRTHLGEIRRVLRPGGRYLFRTPNLFHYVAIVSRFTPHSFHLLVANKLRALPDDNHDPWPTIYAMNTPAAVRRLAAETGFEVEELRLVEKEPSYGMYARPLFLLFMAYERAVNATDLLASLRCNLFVVLRRKD